MSATTGLARLLLGGEEVTGLRSDDAKCPFTETRRHGRMPSPMPPMLVEAKEPALVDGLDDEPDLSRWAASNEPRPPFLPPRLIAVTLP
jgi:hypothetical protein